MNALYPFEGRFLDVGGARLHYLDEGSGPAVLLVHGNPTWSFYFRGLVAGLRGERRMIAPDHIGCGLSEKPPDERYPYTLRRRIEDLAKLIDHLELPERFTLIAHDWGGAIGLGWAVRYPERIERLVLTNTAAFEPPAGYQFPFSLRLFRSPLGAPLVRGLNLFCLGALRHCTARRKLTEEERAGYLLPYDNWANRIAVHRFVQDIPLDERHPSHAELRAIDAGLARLARVPLLLLWGERDFVFTELMRDEWHRRFPHAIVRSFADGGHFLLEDYADESLAAIREFLATPPAPGP